MVASGTGHSASIIYPCISGGSAFVTLFFTTLFSPSRAANEFTDGAYDAVGRMFTSVKTQVMAYKEAKPQMFLYIIAPIVACGC